MTLIHYLHWHTDVATKAGLPGACGKKITGLMGKVRGMLGTAANVKTSSQMVALVLVK